MRKLIMKYAKPNGGFAYLVKSKTTRFYNRFRLLYFLHLSVKIKTRYLQVTCFFLVERTSHFKINSILIFLFFAYRSLRVY